MAKYPIFLELQDRRVLVVGAGPVAQRKTLSLLEAGARVVVVADHVDDNFEAACISSKVELIKSRYEKEYIGKATLVIAATNDAEVNQRIYRDCQQLEILCNIVDDPDQCDFFAPAMVQRGKLQIAIGTGGACPAYAGHLRKKLADLITDEHGRFLAELEIARKQVLESIDDDALRKAILGKLVNDMSFDIFIKNGPNAWQQYATDMMAKPQQLT